MFYQQSINYTVLVTAAINFSLLVFFYKRPCLVSFSRLISLAAFFIAAGQIYFLIKVINYPVNFDITTALMQIGLMIVFVAARGNVKQAGKMVMFHAKKLPDTFRKTA